MQMQYRVWAAGGAPSRPPRRRRLLLLVSHSSSAGCLIEDAPERDGNGGAAPGLPARPWRRLLLLTTTRGTRRPSFASQLSVCGSRGGRVESDESVLAGAAADANAGTHQLYSWPPRSATVCSTRCPTVCRRWSRGWSGKDSFSMAAVGGADTGKFTALPLIDQIPFVVDTRQAVVKLPVLRCEQRAVRCWKSCPACLCSSSTARAPTRTCRRAAAKAVRP